LDTKARSARAKWASYIITRSFEYGFGKIELFLWSARKVGLFRHSYRKTLMNHLPEILRVVSQLRDPKLEVINEDYDKSSPENISKLYYGFKSGEFANDQIASASIYGASPTDTRYTTLKTRLKKRLLNSLFLLDLKRKGYSSYSQTFYSSNKRVFLVKTLITLGARNTAMRIAESELKIAQAYHLTSNTLELLSLLRNHQTFIGASQKYEEYDGLLKVALNTLSLELRAAELYQRLTIKFAKKAQIGEDQASESRAYAEELALSSLNCNSFTFMIASFRVQLLAQQASQDFPSSIRVCDEAEKYLDEHPLLASTLRYGEFALSKLASYRNIAAYEPGAVLFPVGSNSWFYYNEDYFLLMMNTLHFGQAEMIFKEATTHPRFDQLPAHRTEKWKIYDLYLRYALYREKETVGSDSDRSLSKTKTFLRSIPNYAKDKQGLNVAVLILQILYLLESEDFDSIINRMEALRTYRGRYLKSNSNRHSALFFKLLQIMENNSFSYKLTKEKSLKYEEALVGGQASRDISDGLQILPFTWLWEQILSKLAQVEKRQGGVRPD
jgi:hypothetical protein